MKQPKGLAHAVWRCKYHIVWRPKYRFRILKGEIGKSLREIIRQVNRLDRDYLVGKSRGLKEGQIDSGRYELPLLDKKKTNKRQKK